MWIRAALAEVGAEEAEAALPIQPHQQIRGRPQLHLLIPRLIQEPTPVRATGRPLATPNNSGNNCSAGDPGCGGTPGDPNGTNGVSPDQSNNGSNCSTDPLTCTIPLPPDQTTQSIVNMPSLIFPNDVADNPTWSWGEPVDPHANPFTSTPKVPYQRPAGPCQSIKAGELAAGTIALVPGPQSFAFGFAGVNLFLMDLAFCGN